jgi:hypothetical protein
MKPVNAEENPGLAKLPTEVRNKMGYMKKGGLMKKAKRFDEGGEIDDMRDEANKQDIGDDIRARARAFVNKSNDTELISEPPVKAIATKTVTKIKPTPSFTVDRTPESKSMAKAMLSEIKNPSKSETKSVSKLYEPFEGNYIPSKAKPKTLQEKRDMRESRRDSIVSKMSSGGKVKSASARADGCAIRGKTRA